MTEEGIEMTERICEYHGGCTNPVHYSGRGKRSPLCDEHKTVVRREKANVRDKARRDAAKAIKLKWIAENLPQCCVDYIGDNLRRSVCPQHQEWSRISYQNILTRVEREWTEEDELMLDELFSATENGKTWGARIAKNPDSWWTDKELKMRVVKIVKRTIEEEVWLEIPATPVEDGRGDVVDPRKRDDSLPAGFEPKAD